MERPKARPDPRIPAGVQKATKLTVFDLWDGLTVASKETIKKHLKEQHASGPGIIAFLNATDLIGKLLNNSSIDRDRRMTAALNVCNVIIDRLETKVEHEAAGATKKSGIDPPISK